MISLNNQVNTTQIEDLNQLANIVVKKSVNILDKYEIVAILESIGWNDNMARERFGYNDLFSLSEYIWQMINRDMIITPVIEKEKVSRFKYYFRLFRSFLRGMIFVLPMAISVLSMLTLRFSLWSYENFSLSMATSISIGTIMSFMVVGGFTQAIARRGFLYLGQNLVYMARKTVLYFVRIGFITAVVVTISFLIVNWTFAIYPWQMGSIIILYFFFLTSIWLSVTIMYILQKELIFTGLITAGIAIVFVLFILIGINIVYSQLIALTIVTILGLIFSGYYFQRTGKETENGMAPALQRKSVMIYLIRPYFMYGFLYFTYLNLDRLIAWSTDNIYMPYFIWFRGEYELGLDFALLVLMLPMGLIEVVVNEIMLKLLIDQKKYSIKNIGDMNKSYLHYYKKRVFQVSAFCAVNALAIYFLIRYLDLNNVIHLVVIGNRVTHFVLIIGIIAYSVLTLCLMNVLVLFSLAQPKIIMRSMLIATLVNACSGFVFSRWVEYSWAVLGLLLGAIVFFYFSYKGIRKVIKNLDYYIYSGQ
ncbi:MAG: hypothetical protein WCR27_07280 [Eubacteriales bacterium]